MTRLLRFLPSRPWSLKAWKSWFSYVHWRLETYGLYYPDGRFHHQALRRLLHQAPSYFQWLGDMTALSKARRPITK